MKKCAEACKWISKHPKGLLNKAVASGATLSLFGLATNKHQCLVAGGVVGVGGLWALECCKDWENVRKAGKSAIQWCKKHMAGKDQKKGTKSGKEKRDSNNVAGSFWSMRVDWELL